MNKRIMSNRKLATVLQRIIQEKHERSKEDSDGKHRKHAEAFQNNTQSRKMTTLTKNATAQQMTETVQIGAENNNSETTKIFQRTPNNTKRYVHHDTQKFNI